MAVLGLLCGLFSSCEEWGLLSSCSARNEMASLAAEHRLWSMQVSEVAAPGFWRTVSGAVAHGYSCSEVHGIFLDERLNPHLLHWQATSSALSHQGSPTMVLRNPLTLPLSSHPAGVPGTSPSGILEAPHSPGSCKGTELLSI